MKTGAQYVADAKATLGDRRMSDRELGERLADYRDGKDRGIPFSQQHVSRAKNGGYMSDPMAIAIAKAAGVDPGAVLWVARTEREQDAHVRRYLEAWGRTVGKALAPAFAACALMLGLSMWSPDAQAVGGDGRLRPRR